MPKRRSKQRKKKRVQQTKKSVRWKRSNEYRDFDKRSPASVVGKERSYRRVASRPDR